MIFKDSVTILKTLLCVLQQEEYQLDRFNRWIKKHPDLKLKTPHQQINWTPKARATFILCLTINFLSLGKKPVLSIQIATNLLMPLDCILKTILVTAAKIKLAQFKTLTIIGITGSYGKTSTKLILKQILAKKHEVLATPKSYNTPMGIALVILKQLKSNHEIFIVEMGAYKIGEIIQLCRIVKPRIGILTAIGPMHLERFGSLDNIIRTKYELIRSLPESGVAIFNGDDVLVRKLTQQTKLDKITYSTRPPKTISLLVEKREGEKEEQTLRVTMKLLGKYQLANIAAAAAVAFTLGMKLDDIKQAVADLNPPPHRLELKDPGAGILILDDTYSSNPVGFKEALSVLKAFKNRRKILVTPGIVELGGQTERIHLDLGRRATKVCDLIILVGENKRTKAFRRGLGETNFDAGNLYTVKNLGEAQQKIRELGRPMDIILFENDVPDKYL